jgi:hypothetical protein
LEDNSATLRRIEPVQVESVPIDGNAEESCTASGQHANEHRLVAARRAICGRDAIE